MQESYDIYECANVLYHPKSRIYECVALGDRERKIRSEQEERMHVQDVRYVERVRRVSVTLPLPIFFFKRNLKKS